jgi:hypothetical protein
MRRVMTAEADVRQSVRQCAAINDRFRRILGATKLYADLAVYITTYGCTSMLASTVLQRQK